MSPNLIFIGGPARSGTTHLQSLLLPYAVSGPETFLFTHLLPALVLSEKFPRQTRKFVQKRVVMNWEKKLPSSLRGCGDKILRELSGGIAPAALLRLIFGANGNSCILEKTPGHSAYIDQILDLCPNSVFIQLVRDPEDCVASRLETGWRGGVVTGAVKWRSAVVNAVSLKRLKVIRYEDLVSRPEEIVEDLVNHFELTPEHAHGFALFNPQLEPWKVGSQSPTHSNSVGRGKNSLNFLQRSIVRANCFRPARAHRYVLDKPSLVETAGWRLFSSPVAFFAFCKVNFTKRLLKQWPTSN